LLALIVLRPGVFEKTWVCITKRLHRDTCAGRRAAVRGAVHMQAQRSSAKRRSGGRQRRRGGAGMAVARGEAERQKAAAVRAAGACAAQCSGGKIKFAQARNAGRCAARVWRNPQARGSVQRSRYAVRRQAAAAAWRRRRHGSAGRRRQRQQCERRQQQAQREVQY